MFGFIFFLFDTLKFLSKLSAVIWKVPTEGQESRSPEDCNSQIYSVNSERIESEEVSCFSEGGNSQINNINPESYESEDQTLPINKYDGIKEKDKVIFSVNVDLERLEENAVYEILVPKEVLLKAKEKEISLVVVPVYQTTKV